MGDDKTSRPGRPVSHWDDDRRAREGERHRPTAPRGVPTSPIDHERTPVWDGHDLMAPLTHGDAAQLVAWVKGRLEDTGSSDELLTLREQLTAQQLQLAEIRHELAPLTALRRWLWGSAITAVLAIAGLLFSRGYSEGETRQRIEQMDRFVEELRRDVRALETRALDRRSSISPAVSPDAISSANEGRYP